MRFIYFGLTVFTYLIFAYDIENDRDFMTWIWLATACYFAINTHVAYKKFKSRKDKTEDESEVLNIPRVSKHSELLISFMEELTTKDIELIKQYKYEEVVESVKRNL